MTTEAASTAAMDEATMQELVAKYYSDPTARDARAEPFAFWTALRSFDPVFHFEAQDRWMITGYEEMKQAGAYPDFSYKRSSKCPYNPAAAVGRSRSLLNESFMLYLDPPEHSKYRAAVRRTFSGPTARKWRPIIRGWARDIVRQLPRDEEFDFVSELALPVPFHFTCQLLGIPFEDWHKIKRYADDFQRLFLPHPSPEEERTGDQNFEMFCDYLAPYLEARESGRVFKDDLLQEFVEAKQRGEFTADEVAMFAQILTVGGHETTTALFTQGMIDLLDHPDQWQLLKDTPEMIEQAVEEILRFSGPSIQMQERYPTEDIMLGGHLIPKGATVVTHPSAANRDPRVFDNPERLDVTRDHANLAFGFGPHFCIAASLVRVEAQEIFSAIAEEAPGIEITQTEPVEYSTLDTLRMPQSLKVRIPS
nr:cytochrome P450 [Rhodococcus sp. 06-1059B-a]